MIRATTLCAVLTLLAGCGGPLTPALIGAGIGFAASALDADVTVLGWHLCQRGNRAACGGASHD